MSELKPCPFCGGDAEVRHSVTCGYDSYWVECKDFKNCRGSVSPVTDVESVAVEAWNTRHVETCNAELANRYIELPLDADGVPIHIGDMLSSDEYRGRQFPCRGMSVGVRNGKYWTVCMDYDSYSGTSEWCAASRCHHVR